MKRTIVVILTALAAVALFYLLVHAVLVAAHVSEPTPTTVRGMTPRRIWALAADALGLTAVVLGAFALRRTVSSFGTGTGRMTAIVGLCAGLLAVVNGGLNLAVATGGPGSGNGVIGAAGALVLGLMGMTLSGLALIRARAKTDSAMVK